MKLLATLVFTRSHNQVQVQDGNSRPAALSCQMHEVAVEDQCCVSPNFIGFNYCRPVTSMPVLRSNATNIIWLLHLHCCILWRFHQQAPAAGGEGTFDFANKWCPVGDTSFHQQALAASGEGTLDFTNKCPVGDTSFHQQMMPSWRHFISPTSPDSRCGGDNFTNKCPVGNT